jgi:hypothetical protein
MRVKVGCKWDLSFMPSCLSLEINTQPTLLQGACSSTEGKSEGEYVCNATGLTNTFKQDPPFELTVLKYLRSNIAKISNLVFTNA